MSPILERRRVPALICAWLALALAGAAVAATDAGAAAWRPPVPVPGPVAPAGGLDVAAGPDGTVIAVWSKQTAGGKQVVASVRPPGGGFSTPAPLGSPGGDAPQVAIDGNGTATVVWEQRVGGTTLLTIEQSTRPAGGDFGLAAPLSSFSDESRWPVLAVNSRGDTVVAWTNRTLTERIQARARRAGEPDFGPVQELSGTGSANAAFSPAVAVGDDGSGLVAWEREGGILQAAPWAAALNGFGSKFVVTSGAAGSEYGYEPAVAVTPTGAGLIAYHGGDGGAGPAIRCKTRANGVISGALDIASLPTASGSPALVADRAGDVLATWDSGSSVMRAAYRPAGQGFEPPVTLSGNQAKGFSPPSAAFTPAGDAVVAWVAGPDGAERVQARVKRHGGGFATLQDDFPTHVDVAAPTAFADGEGNMGTLALDDGGSDPGSLELRPFDAAPPRPAGLSLPSGAVERAGATFAAKFVDTWSPATLSWAFGDGTVGAGSPVGHAFAAPGTYKLTVKATDAAGNAAAQSGMLAVRALEAREIDADHDGFSADKDCDDTSPAIRPGARELPGNAVDENCDRIVEPFPKVAATASLVSLFGPDFTQLEALSVRDLAAGDRVRLSCRGKGCRRALATRLKITRKTRLLRLSKRVRGVRLRKGARLELRIAHSGYVARVFRFTVKRFGTVPQKSELCQAPGAARPGRC